MREAENQPTNQENLFWKLKKRLYCKFCYFYTSSGRYLVPWWRRYARWIQAKSKFMLGEPAGRWSPSSEARALELLCWIKNQHFNKKCDSQLNLTPDILILVLVTWGWAFRGSRSSSMSAMLCLHVPTVAQKGQTKHFRFRVKWGLFGEVAIQNAPLDVAKSD